MTNQSLKSRTLRGAGWSFIDSFLGQGITFVVGLVLARLLSPEDYGLLAYLLIMVSVSNSIVDSGFSNALIRKQNATEVDYNTVFISNMVCSLALVAVLYVSAPAISAFFDQPQLTVLLRAMSAVIVINAFAIIQRTILTKTINFKTQTKASVISSLTSAVVGVGMALGGMGVWSLVGQQISRQLLFTVCLWVFSKWWPRLLFSWKSFTELFGFGWKLLVSGLIATIWTEIYQLVIGKCYTAVTLGQYTRAQQFASICSSNLTSIIQRVSYPVLSEIQDDKPRLKAAYKKVIRVTMLVTFTLMLGLAAVAEPMIRVLIGDKWLPAVPMLQIVCLNMMFYPLHAINLNMLQVQGRSDLFLKLEIVKKVVAVGPLLLGVFVGIYWMLAGSVLTGIISLYLNAYYSGPFLDYSIKEQVKDVLPGLGMALVMAALVYAISCIALAPAALLGIQLVAGALIMIALCELFRLPEYTEMKGMLVRRVRSKY